MGKFFEQLLRNRQRERALRRNLNEVNAMLVDAESARRDAERENTETQKRITQQNGIIARLNMELANRQNEVASLTRSLAAKETDALLWQNRAMNLRDIVIAMDTKSTAVLPTAQEASK